MYKRSHVYYYITYRYVCSCIILLLYYFCFVFATKCFVVLDVCFVIFIHMCINIIETKEHFLHTYYYNINIGILLHPYTNLMYIHNALLPRVCTYKTAHLPTIYYYDKISLFTPCLA